MLQQADVQESNSMAHGLDRAVYTEFHRRRCVVRMSWIGLDGVA